MLPEKIKKRALSVAHEYGISFGELVRRSIEKMIHETQNEIPFDRDNDSLFKEMKLLATQTQSQIIDASTNHDDYLYHPKGLRKN